MGWLDSLFSRRTIRSGLSVLSVGEDWCDDADHYVASGTSSTARIRQDKDAFVQQVEIDRATIITSAGNGSPRSGFLADFSEKIAIRMREITAAPEQSADLVLTSCIQAAQSCASSASNTSRADPAR